MATITLTSDQQSMVLHSRTGETIHETLSRYGIFHSAPCGGQGLCKHCKVVVRGIVSPPDKKEYEFLTDEELLKGVRLCCMTVPLGDCQVLLPSESLSRQEPAALFSQLPTEGKHGYALGIDIGTTTLAVYLYSRKNGAQMAVASAQNRQSVFGDDVISRIQAVTTLNALPRLQQSVCKQLSDMIHSVCDEANITLGEIKACAVAANTTMLHLLTGLDPTEMGKAPFTPQSLFGTMYRGEQLDLPLQCEVYLIPCISAYVGGDITAGMVVCDMDETNQTQLLIDVGTNGEMVLCHEGQLFCLATAAGPAFEGAHIKNGVGGVDGAISKIDQHGYQTIGNKPPVGICGSGLIDAVALMLQQSVVDETGYLEEEHPLADTTVTICPKDIREIQLAKSAVCSGVLRLCELAGIEPNAIDKVYLAGGFGSHINPESAAAVGLIPKELAHKCQSAGNTAGFGSVRAALSDAFRQRMEDLPERVTYFELSGDARFNELFMENMLFEG